MIIVKGQEQRAEKLLSKAVYEEEVTGELEKAMKAYRLIIKQYPNNRKVSAEALLHLGICYEKLGLLQAHETYLDLINRYPEQKDKVAIARERVIRLEEYTANIYNKAEQHFNKGNELLKLWEYEAAIKEYKNVIKLKPDSRRALDAKYWIGQAYYKNGQYDEALSSFEKLIKEYPESTITPVTELMIEQVEHAIENNNGTEQILNYSDENTIVDPETGITYSKVKTFTGKNDLIMGSGGFNLSPDGRLVVLENKVVPLDGSSPFDLVDMKALRAVYAPGMKKAAFYADSAIWTVPVSPETGHANGRPEKLLDGGYRYQHIVSWSPDGEKIAFCRFDETYIADIWTLSVSDGKLQPVTNFLGSEHSPAWSPDGKTIAYRRGSEIWLASTFGDETKMILKNGGYPIWSPDGNWLFHSKYLYSMEHNTNFSYTAPKQVGDFIGFSPNRKKMLLYRSSYTGKWGMKVVSISGGPSFKPALSDAVYGSTWSAEGKYILAQSENEKGNIIFKIVPLTGEKSVIINIKTDVNGNPFPFCASPDMTQLAFRVERQDGKEDLYIIPFSIEEASTTGPARLVFEGWTGGAYNVTFSWSYDGTKLALIHETDIWIVPLDGGSPQQITNTPEGERNVNWSPDGKMISYNTLSKQTGILHTITANGENSKVVNNDCHESQWSPDSKNLAVTSLNKLLIIGLDGKKVKDFELSKKVVIETASDLNFSPNGKYFAFIGNKNDESIIYVYSFETNQITCLGDDCLNDYKYGLNWSPDGKWLSYLTYEEEKVLPEGVLWEADFEEVLEKIRKE